MRYLILCLLVCLSSGCTVMSLERHTVAQIDSAIDLRYREIVDNLAAVAADPSTLPSFVSIYSGTVSVQDTGTAISSVTWPYSAGMTSVNPSFNRQIAQNWVLDPTIIPEKLEAIRAALQWAIGGPNHVNPDSMTLLLAPKQVKADTQRHFGVSEKLERLPTSWLCIGCLKDVPACARYKGHSGDVWVWVTPEGMRGLAEFTIIIQDIARAPINSPTLFNPPPFYSPIVFKTGDPQKPDGRLTVTAQVVVDQSRRLYADPFIPTRLDNTGADASIRSIITAASITTVPH